MKEWRIPRYFISGVITITVILIIWEVTEDLLFTHPFIPPPSTIFTMAFEMISSGELALHIASSLEIYATGFLLSLGTALPLGMLIGRIEKARVFLAPIIKMVNPVPCIAFLPLVILWFGIGVESRVFIMWLGMFIVIILNVVEGCRNIDPILVRAGQSLDANRLQTFIHIVLPSVFPYVIVGVRVAAASGLRVLVAAEMLAAKAGVGFLILHASIWLEYAKVFVGLGTLTALCFAVDRGINAVAENVLLKYRKMRYEA